MKINDAYQENALLIYKGAFTVNLISTLGNQIKLLPEIDFKVVQKLFRVFMELTQNVSYYSAETVPVKSGVSCGSGWVSLQDLDDCFQISTGNRIQSGHGEKLMSYCTEINGFEDAALKKLKRDIRSQALERDTGAQLGLIQTSIISGHKLDYKIIKDASGKDFFVISTRLKKDDDRSITDV